MDATWTRLTIGAVPEALGCRFQAPPGNIIDALNRIETDPASHQWLRMDGRAADPDVGLNLVSAASNRADVQLTLAMWLGAIDLPAPTAQKTFRAMRTKFPGLKDSALNLLSAVAIVQMVDRVTAPVAVDRLVLLLDPGDETTLTDQLALLEGEDLIYREDEGWMLNRSLLLREESGPDVYQTNWGPLSVLVMDGMAESRRLEGWGLHLVRRTIDRMDELLRAEKEELPDRFNLSFEGPHFQYRESANIFRGRVGFGPLYIAWDTNLLIDYFDHGTEVWTGASLPSDLDSRTYEMLEGLELLLALAVVRDIRFVLLPEILNDYKRALSKNRLMERLQAIERFEAALRLSESGEPEMDLISRQGLLDLPRSALEEALTAVPDGGDRRLVRAAVKRGVHVFLTKDDGVLKAQSQLHPFGLRITDTQELLEDLVRAGAYHCIFQPDQLAWPLPDQQGIANLIQGLPSHHL